MKRAALYLGALVVLVLCCELAGSWSGGVLVFLVLVALAAGAAGGSHRNWW